MISKNVADRYDRLLIIIYMNSFLQKNIMFKLELCNKWYSFRPSSESADHGWGSGVRESGRRGGIEGATDVGLETAFRWPKVLLLPRRQKCYQQVRNFEQKVRSDDQKTRKMNQQVPDKLRKFSNSRPFHNQTFEKCSMKRYSWIKRSSFLTKMLSLKVSVLWS